MVTRGDEAASRAGRTVDALGNAEEVDVMRNMRADFVLAADCSYDPTLIPGLVRAIGALWGRRRAMMRTSGRRSSLGAAAVPPPHALDADGSRRRRVRLRAVRAHPSAVRQEETMEALIHALERARLHPVDVTSVVEEVRAVDATSPKFLAADADAAPWRSRARLCVHPRSRVNRTEKPHGAPRRNRIEQKTMESNGDERERVEDGSRPANRLAPPAGIMSRADATPSSSSRLAPRARVEHDTDGRLVIDAVDDSRARAREDVRSAPCAQTVAADDRIRRRARTPSRRSTRVRDV